MKPVGKYLFLLLLRDELAELRKRVEVLLVVRTALVQILIVGVDQSELHVIVRFGLLLNLVGGQQRVKSYLKDVGQHSIKYLFLRLVLFEDVGVVVYFKEPHSEVFINQKVVAQKLKAKAPLLGVDVFFR